MSKSSVAINNLRGYAILMVLAFHSFIAYLGSQTDAPARPFDSSPYEWAGKPIIDRDGWFGFDLFCAFQYVHLMQLMFFLSGLFVWSSLARKGARAFLYDRVLRLGVPFVFGVYLLMPVAYYPVYRLTAADPGWPAFWSHWIALPFWPTGPIWFLWCLLVLNLAAAALFRLAPGAGELLTRLSAAAAAMCAATSCLGLSAVFLRFAAVPAPLFASLSEHAYGIYLVHYVFVIWLQYLLLGVALFAVAKAAIVFAGTLILSWSVTAAMCRLSIGARLIGGKRREWAKAP